MRFTPLSRLPHEARFMSRAAPSGSAAAARAPRDRGATGRTRRISHLMRVQELAETAERTAEPGQRCRCQNTNTQDYTLQFRGHS